MLLVHLSGINVFTVSFKTTCSYKPPMMAIAVTSYRSWELIREADEYVLSVPGESLRNETLQCGIVSLTDQDKVRTLKLDLHPSERCEFRAYSVSSQTLNSRNSLSIETGDHSLVVGVIGNRCKYACRERPLISIGPDTRGYTVLAQKGYHRIAICVLADEPSVSNHGGGWRLAHPFPHFAKRWDKRKITSAM